MSLNPRIFQIIAAAAPVTALLGINPIRFYPFGQAPKNAPKPYAVYSVFNGIPENYLDRVPDIDNMGTQVDVYADTAASCNACYTAIRNAIEPKAHMISFSTPGINADTGDYQCRMEFDIWEHRT